MAGPIERTKVTTRSLMVAADLGATVIKQIAGNEVANTIGQSPLTKELLVSLIASKIVQRLESRGKV